MEKAIDPGTYILEEVELEFDSDSDGEYKTVEVDSDSGTEEEDQPQIQFEDRPKIVKHNEVVDDYVRNFLRKMNMQETLSAFQKEWYEKNQETLFKDLSEEIANIKNEISSMEAEKKKWADVCEKVQETWDRLKQERNYHKESLGGLLKEKDELLEDQRKMKKTTKRLTPAMKELQQRFEQVNKERAMLRLERDKLTTEIQQLQREFGTPQNQKD